MTVYSPNNIRVLNGKRALAIYHNVMKEYYGSKFNISLAELERRVLLRNPDFFAQLGDAVIDSKFGEGRMKESMERVAEVTSISPLSIPDAFGFVNGIAEELSSFDVSLFGDAALSIGVDAGKGSVKIVNAVGSTVVGTVENTADIIKNSKWIILVVVIFLGALIWRISKNLKLSDLKLF